MSSPTTTLPLPDVSPDVQAFAEKEGVAAYLPAVVAMTRRIFPTWPIKVFLEDDPEIANDWHIVLEVEVPDGVDVDRIVEADWQWSREIFEHCPSTHVCVFRLGMM
jgi:hypothetical protein